MHPCTKKSRPKGAAFLLFLSAEDPESVAFVFELGFCLFEAVGSGAVSGVVDVDDAVRVGVGGDVVPAGSPVSGAHDGDGVFAVCELFATFVDADL